MLVRSSPFVAGLLLCGLLPHSGGAAHKKEVQTAGTGPAVLWREPRDISRRNLFYGPGGEQNQPRAPFLFIKEDLEGSNPKFVVRDGNGVRWKVKLGVEARPETVATRLVWAVGYNANQDYFLKEMRVANLPRLHRGRKLISPDGTVRNVRLKREEENKLGEWKWRHDPFTATREWNGLRVMMAVMNNWDLKDVNNAIYQERDARNYAVSDLGSTFGTAGITWPLSKAKGNLKSYSRSRFIRRRTATTVDFAVPGRPEFVYLVHPRDYFRRLPMRSLGKNIPRADARWIGDLLARLSPRQIRDAFRAAGYSPAEVEGFSRVLQNRIAQLTEL